MTYAIIGLALIGLTIAMILAGRPADGVAASFLKSWPLGQTYALAAMASAVSGVALLITNWPF